MSDVNEVRALLRIISAQTAIIIERLAERRNVVLEMSELHKLNSELAITYELYLMSAGTGY